MKRPVYLLLISLSFLATCSFAQQVTRTTNTMSATAMTSKAPHCVDITAEMKSGGLRFVVADNEKKYTYYPTRYKLKFFLNGEKIKGKKNHGKGQKFYLKKKANDTVKVNLDLAPKNKYCVCVSRNAIFNVIFKKIGWGPVEAGTSINKDQVTYYVSSSRGNIPLFTKIVSKDGPTGDGVKVLID